MADTELKPCPFCGGAACIESNRDWHRLYADHDDECVFEADDHALMYPAQPGYLIQIAVDWNRRAALASRPAAGNAVVGKRREIATKTAETRMDSGFHGGGQIASRPADPSLKPVHERENAESLTRAEVDDEGLPPLPEPKYCADDLTDIFTAEQYRQGQRDAVAADRARRGVQS